MQVLHKYIAMYAATLLKDGNPDDALELYVQHGAPANPQNYNIYKRIVQDILGNTGSGLISFKRWASLRNMLFSLCKNMEQSDVRLCIS